MRWALWRRCGRSLGPAPLSANQRASISRLVGFRLYDPKSQKVFTQQDIKFNEEELLQQKKEVKVESTEQKEAEGDEIQEEHEAEYEDSQSDTSESEDEVEDHPDQPQLPLLHPQLQQSE